MTVERLKAQRTSRRSAARRPSPNPRILEAMRDYVPNRNHIHLEPTDGKWQVRREGATRASRIVASKAAAIEIAETLVRGAGDAQLIIHRPDVSIEERRPLGRAASAGS